MDTHLACCFYAIVLRLSVSVLSLDTISVVLFVPLRDFPGCFPDWAMESSTYSPRLWCSLFLGRFEQSYIVHCCFVRCPFTEDNWRHFKDQKMRQVEPPNFSVSPNFIPQNRLVIVEPLLTKNRRPQRYEFLYQ